MKEQYFFEKLFGHQIEINHYLFDGSACVFPGVRRYVNARGKRQAYNFEEGAILDDNVFPRHIWCFLLKGTAFSGPAWKGTGLGEFELAHIFSHKPSEIGLENQFFHKVDKEVSPFSNFTCGANIVLLPKGTVRPTDNSASIKSIFYKRHIELFGESTLKCQSGFKEDKVPSWYGSLHWNSPILPPGWRENLQKLFGYRKNRLTNIMAKFDQPESVEIDV